MGYQERNIAVQALKSRVLAFTGAQTLEAVLKK